MKIFFMRLLNEILILIYICIYIFVKRKLIRKNPEVGRSILQKLSPLKLKLRQNQPVYWLHAVSVGESNVAAVMIRELRRQAPEAVIVLSVTTNAGYSNACNKIKAADEIFYMRFDLFFLVKSMFSSIRPTALIVIEGDYWFNLFSYARSKNIPLFIVNGKISERSLASYKKLHFVSKYIFSSISHAFLQTKQYLQRYTQLAIPASRCSVDGNMKLDFRADTPDIAEQQQLKNTCSNSNAPLIVFGSLHPPEETVAITAMQSIWEHFPEAAAVIIPRHPEKSAIMRQSIAAAGCESALWSQLQSAKDIPPHRVTIIDAFGMSMKFYSIADVVIVGGTFTSKVGGHNICEPALFAKPVVYGPHIFKQSGLHELIEQYNAGICCEENMLGDILLQLLENPSYAATLGKNGAKMLDDARNIAAAVAGKIIAMTAAG